MAAGSKAMAPKLRSDDGRHIVIRPLAYVCERDIAALCYGMRFPLIPCTLCGSQPNLQRQAIKQMLQVWEREQPGRLQSIFSALRRVEPETLADPRLFDFSDLVERCRRHCRPFRMGMNRPLPNSYWVLPGSLLAGEYPHADDPVPERASLGLLLRAGIDAFIDLTHPGERPEYQSLLPADVR